MNKGSNRQRYQVKRRPSSHTVMMFIFPFANSLVIQTLDTSVLNQHTSRNNPEDGRLQFDRGGSLRFRTA
jgi:hypothetical protein